MILLLLVFILLRQSRDSKLKKCTEEILSKLDTVMLFPSKIQAHIDEKSALNHEVIYNAISGDREKQLASIADLKIALEKRFFESGMVLNKNISEFKSELIEKFNNLSHTTELSLTRGQVTLTESFNLFQEKMTLSMSKHQNETGNVITANFKESARVIRNELDRSIRAQNELIKENIGHLTNTTDKRLKEISSEVDKRLSEGFDKTTETFTDILKRLALIDDAQKKISELSGNVISLQEILNDKRSRGAFGEIQLHSLISNLMPESHYVMQETLTNNKVVDCLLLLPEPTGKVAIDAKFPLESYKKMTDIELAEADRRDASKQFIRDIKKHINDISDKYILPPETSDGAVMFIPAESVFAEIHGHYPELIEYAYQKKVWLVSPTTLMAILTTAATVIKDEQTRKQVHIIKEHLSVLGRDFARFQSRMDNLSRHIGMVTKDVEQVTVSAKKISSRFSKIERVEVNQVEEQPVLDSEEPV